MISKYPANDFHPVKATAKIVMIRMTVAAQMKTAMLFTISASRELCL
jgi:hypothetical protein